MRHVSDGVLRRLADEPLAVPDAARAHLTGCSRCGARQRRVLEDMATAHRLVVRPQLVPDVDRAWARFHAHPAASGRTQAERAARGVAIRRRHWRLMGAGATSGAAIAAGGALLVGAAAAATLTTVFAPTQVAPLPVTHGDLQAFSQVLGLDGTPTAAGSSGPQSWAFGSIEWSARPKPVQTSSLQAAESATGLNVALPATLPAGVTGPPRYVVEKEASAVVTFDARAGTLGGSTLDLTLGPGVLAVYGGSVAKGAPALAVLAMARPTATSSGASTAALESFLLAQPGFPADLARQIRLLGNLETVLPVPTPSGVSETSTTVDGSPAVLLAEPGGVATAVVWEGRDGVVRVVGGLVDQQDALGVARQLG